MGETPKNPAEPTSEIPSMGGAVNEQGDASQNETTAPAPKVDQAELDAEAIRKGREMFEQLQYNKEARDFMEKSKIEQRVTPINPAAKTPSEIPPFLQQTKQPLQKKGPNTIQKFLRIFFGEKN
ncbi:MAG: hypothetical protein Q8P56_04465 [Candidatus Uhrbacteria bacterium]|nr:hypothetical protein [Candidatus Uhrbacteria bacterium]